MTDMNGLFAAEFTPLLVDLQNRGPAEAGMRVRALAEIAQALTTEGLLNLAAHLTATDEAAAPIKFQTSLSKCATAS